MLFFYLLAEFINAHPIIINKVKKNGAILSGGLKAEKPIRLNIIQITITKFIITLIALEHVSHFDKLELYGSGLPQLEHIRFPFGFSNSHHVQTGLVVSRSRCLF